VSACHLTPILETLEDYFLSDMRSCSLCPVAISSDRHVETHHAVVIWALRNTEFTRVGTSIMATIYLQLIQNRFMFRSFTVLHCSHQHCVQPVASDVEVVGYLNLVTST